MGKILAIIAGIVVAIGVGLQFGIIPGLIVAAIASYVLKRSGMIASDSPLVSETEGVRKTKYAILIVFIIIILVLGYLAVFG